jgi:D-3-phosphoglycerate dehydrogenase / 2-oxoglutarate reductase
MSLQCLIVQPIHADGLAVLEAAGVVPVSASASTMNVVAREIADADAVITRNAGLDRAAIDAAPRLRVIGNHGVGLDPVNVAHASALGIAVVFTPAANAVAVAEHAVGLVLAVAKQLLEGDRATRAGDFDFKYRSHILELRGKNLGVIGFGRIGRLTAETLVRGFGMRLLVHAPTAPDAAIEALDGARAGSLDTLLEASDVVSLHVPLRQDTVGLIGARELALCKPNAILVNTARGAVVDEDGLVRALREGRLGGAGLDVYGSETMPADHPLLGLPNVVLTPHVGGSALEAGRRTAVQVAEQVIEVLRGRRPEHLVNPGMWDRRRR